MKSVKNLVSALLLAAVFAVSVNAGDTHAPGYTTPSPTPSPEGVIAYDETPVICDPDTGCLSTETSDSLFYEALAALLSVY
jgi:hypothetical protein